MSISCQMNPQQHWSVQLLLSSVHPSWSPHPHAATSGLQTTQNSQRLSQDELKLIAVVLFFPQRSGVGCAESGDFVQLLGGNGIDTSKLLPITDLCISFTGPSECRLTLPAHPSPESFLIIHHMLIWSLLLLLLFLALRHSSHEDRLWKHGGEDGVQREVCQQGVVQLQATGQPGAADHQTQQRGGFLFQ